MDSREYLAGRVRDAKDELDRAQANYDTWCRMVRESVNDDDKIHREYASKRLGEAMRNHEQLSAQLRNWRER